jgi:hypothetical protein
MVLTEEMGSFLSTERITPRKAALMALESCVL